MYLKSIELVDSRYRVTTVSNALFDFTEKQLSHFDFSFGRAKLLGDMTPSSRDWTPLIANASLLSRLRSLKLPRANRSFDNRPLELQIGTGNGFEIREFKNGYAMVGGSKLAFQLGKNYERLTGWVGFSPRAGQAGNLLFRVSCDGDVILEKAMNRGQMSEATEIKLDVKDRERLVIEVDYLDGRAIGDLLHLCDWKVAK